MLVILHGWSDSAESFDNIAARLAAANLGYDIATIRLADYVSLDDVVTFGDLREAMQVAWNAKGLPTGKRSVDIIVHSTGALVVRDWMTTYFKPDTNPIKRLVMLAPANFGSPLASKARSFIGRVVKGFHAGNPGQTGTQLLKGLEIASPYSWNLAMRDRFNDGEPWYGENRVLCTVLVGTAGYGGIRAIANSPGSDGTVRVSTANLNPHLFEADFSVKPDAPTITEKGYNGHTAFLRIPNENHGTIAQGGSATTFARIVQALQVSDAGFDAWRLALDTASEAARVAEAGDEDTHGYQNTTIHLVDDMGDAVKDYLIEAFVPEAVRTHTAADVDENQTQFVQEKVLVDAHVYCDDGSYRALLFNCTKLKQGLIDNKRNLELSVTAMPQVKDGSAGYSTFGFDEIGGILLNPIQQGNLFAADRTLLVNMKIQRQQLNIFDFREPSPVAPKIP